MENSHEILLVPMILRVKQNSILRFDLHMFHKLKLKRVISWFERKNLLNVLTTMIFQVKSAVYNYVHLKLLKDIIENVLRKNF